MPSTARFNRLDLVAGRVSGLVEKPADGRPGAAKAGLTYLSAAAVGWARSRPPSVDRFGEQSMTELLIALLRQGFTLASHQLIDGFHDIGTSDGLAAAVADSRLSWSITP
jgi:dTDP-glucose pyrophosphorylase